MTHRQAAGEGVAEFMSFYLKNRETTAIDYPETTAYLREKLSGNDMAPIDALVDEVNAHYVIDADSTQPIRTKEPSVFCRFFIIKFHRHFHRQNIAPNGSKVPKCFM